MAVAFDAASEENGVGTTSPFTWTHTIGSSGTNRIILVGYFFYYWTAYAGDPVITYGGETLTKIGASYDDTYDSALGLYYLVGPPQGANTVSLTYGGGAHISPMAVSYTGVDQSSPIGTAVTTFSTGSGTKQVILTSEDDELCVCVAGGRNIADESTLAPASGETERVDEWSHSGSGAERNAGAMAEETGAASVTMSYSGFAADGKSGLIGVPLKPAPAGRDRTVKYTHNSYMSRGREVPLILDAQGRMTPPEQLDYDSFVFIGGPGFPTPKKYTSAIEDPAVEYIESITVDSEGKPRIQTAKESLLDSLFRRLTRPG